MMVGCIPEMGKEEMGTEISLLDSLPSGYRMCAYAGFILVNSTSSTSWLFSLLRTNRLSITLPGADNQVGKEDPQGERR